MPPRIDAPLREESSRFLMFRWLHALRFWLDCARWQAFGQSLLPAVLALVLVWGEDGFSLSAGILAVLGVLLVHTSTNLLDDYFDYRCESVQVRQAMVDGGMRARSHKCHYILSGATTLGRLLAAALVFGGLAVVIGLYLVWLRGVGIAAIAAAGAFCCYFYSAPPIRLSFHYLGEAAVGVVFGPILMSGVSLAACGRVSAPVLFFSIPIGILVTNIVYTHAILDFEPDRRAGKNTLAVFFGSPKRAFWLMFAMVIAAYVIPAAAVAGGRLSPKMLLMLLTLPMACGLIRSVRRFVRAPNETVRRRFWMGPMEYWPQICQAGIDWYMVRWYLSRNLLTFYCVLIAAAAIWDRAAR